MTVLRYNVFMRFNDTNRKVPSPMSSLEAHEGFFLIAYEVDFGSIYTETF